MTAGIEVLKTSVSSPEATTDLLSITDPELLKCTSKSVTVPYWKVGIQIIGKGRMFNFLQFALLLRIC